MAKGKFTGEMIDQLGEFLVNDVADKLVFGITYCMYLDDNVEDRKKIDRYDDLRNKMKSNGIDPDTIFQKIKVTNGYVYNLEVEVARKIMGIVIDRMNRYSKTDRGKKIRNDIFKDKPTKRRVEDIQEMAKYLIKSYKKDNPHGEIKRVEVAIFSRNSTNKIVCMAKDAKDMKKDKMLNFMAYAIRQYDLNEVNKIMISNGFKIIGSRIGEILPSKTGVRYTISVDRME